jgi:hypothetical protein
MRSQRRGAFSFETKLRQGSDGCEGQQESNDLQGEAEHTNDKIQKIHAVQLPKAMAFISEGRR